MSNPRILLVEDHDQDRELLLIAVDVAGFEAQWTFASDVRGAMDALDRVDRLGEPAPELAIVDLSLPDGSGHQVLQSLRGRPALSRTPAVVLSTSSSPSDRAHAAASGAATYLVKPHDFEGYLALVQTLFVKLRAS